MAYFGLVRQQHEIQKHDTATINLSGRQRMLSQRITKCVLAITSPAHPESHAAYAAEAEVALREWADAHRRLLDYEVTRNSPRILWLFDEIEPDRRAIVDAATRLLALHRQNTGSAAEMSGLVDDILAAEAPFLRGMEQIVAGYQQIGAVNLERLRLLEGCVLAALLLTLSAEAFFLFRPIARRIHDAAETHLMLERTRRHEAALIAALPDTIYVFDTSGRCLECRIPPDTIPLKPSSELVGKHYADFLPPEVAIEFDKVWVRLKCGESLATCHYSIPVGGVVRRYETRCTRYADDQVLCLASDVTQRHEAQHALEEERRLLSTIFEDSRAGYWDMDLALGVAFYSPSYKAMLGYRENEFPDHPDTWRQHAFDQDVTAANELFQKHVASRGRTPFSTHLRYRHKDGSTIHVIASGRVISWSPDDKPLRFVGCQLNVTALYNAQESIARLALVARHTGSSVIFTDVDRRINWVNAAFTQITGYTEAECIGRKPSFLQGPDTSPATVAAIRAALDAGETYRGEIINYSKDGTPYWIEIELMPHVAADGALLGFIGVQTDISLRKEAEMSLRERDARFAALSRHIPGVIYQFRLSTSGVASFDYVSEGSERVWGFTHEHVMSPEFTRFEHVHIEDRIQLQEAIRISAERLTPFEFTHRHQNPVLGPRWIHAASTPVRAANGDTVWHGYASDISELVNAQQAVRDNEERLRVIIDNIPSSVLLKDPEGRCLLINRTGLAAVGLDYHDWNGRTDDEIFANRPDFADHLRRWRATDEEAWRSRTALTFEESFGPPAQTYEWAKIPLFHPDGSRRALIIIANDITDRKRAESALRERDERFAAISRHVPGVIYQYRTFPDGTYAFTYVSDGALALWGVSRETIFQSGQPLLEYVHPDDRAAMLNAGKKAAQAMRSFQNTLRYQHPKLGLRWHRTHDTPTAEPDGTILWHGYASDITDLIVAQQEVRDNEVRLRALVETIPAAIFLKDGAGRWLVVNRNGLKAMGLLNHAWQGRTDRDFAVELPDRAVFFQVCLASDEQAWLSGRSITSEEIIPDADGTLRAYEVTKVPLFNDEGSRRALLIVATDITERKNAAVLLERERKLFAAGPVAVLVTSTDPGWPINYVSENIHSLLGYTSEELSADQVSYADLIHPQDLPGLIADTHARLAAYSPFFESSYRLRHRDGTYRWFYEFTSPEYSQHRICTSIRSYLFDQTKLKQAQDELRTREEQIAAISIHIPGVLYEFKPGPGGGSFPYTSDGLRDLFALDPELVRQDGSAFFKRIHPEDVPTVNVSIKDSASACCDWTLEFRIMHPERGLRWIHGSSSPRLLDDGTYVWDGYLFDITERKNNEERLLREGKREAIERLAGGIVHDFNNYLSAISLSVDLLNGLPEAGPRIRDIIATLANEVDAATSVARQLLAFTKDQPVQRGRILVADFLRDCASFALRGCSMLARITVTDHVLEIETDPDLLRQVIFNLVLNSRQAMQGKGNVMLSATSAPDGTITIRVADDGPGIPAGARAKIFEPYFTTKSGGSGLGLFVVRSLLLRLGGDIRLDASSLVGAVFLITLPPSPAANRETCRALPALTVTAGKPASTPPFGALDQARPHVLLLEDEPGQTMLLSNFFECINVSIDTFTDGEALLAAAPAHEHRGARIVCLLDISVRGGMGGIDIAPALRKLLPDARIFLVSGYSADWQEREKSVAGLGIGFIAKPYHLKELKERLFPSGQSKSL